MPFCKRGAFCPYTSSPTTRKPILLPSRQILSTSIHSQIFCNCRHWRHWLKPEAFSNSLLPSFPLFLSLLLNFIYTKTPIIDHVATCLQLWSFSKTHKSSFQHTKNLIPLYWVTRFHVGPSMGLLPGADIFLRASLWLCSFPLPITPTLLHPPCPA